MTKFTTDVLYAFLNSGAFTSDLSKDTTYMKVDQLPPFNLTLLFADEYGNTSSQRLLGVELVTSGDVYSIQDMLSEQTILELRQILKDEYGRELTPAETSEVAYTIVGYFTSLAKMERKISKDNEYE